MLLLFAGATPDPLDHLFGWQLLTVLQAIGALRVEGKSGCAIVQVSLLCFDKSVRSCSSKVTILYVIGRPIRTFEVRC